MSKKTFLAAAFVLVVLAGTVVPVVAVSATDRVEADRRIDVVDVGASESTDDVPASTSLPVHDTSSTVSGVSSPAYQGSRVGDHVIRALHLFDLPGWLLLAGYSRYDSSDPLENDVRRRVFEAIERSPGTYPVELAVTTGVPRSTVRYHVRILEEEALVFGEKVRGKQRYFPRESDDVELFGALRDEASRSVLRAIDRLEPVTVSDLASDLDRAPSTISYHLTRLADAGLVEQERDDGAVLNRLSHHTKSTLQRHLDGVVELPAGSSGTPR